MITRLTEHDHNAQLQSLSTAPVPTQRRSASTSPEAGSGSTPGIPAVATSPDAGSTPGIPAASEATVTLPPDLPAFFLATRIPDLRKPLPVPSVQIVCHTTAIVVTELIALQPFVPDFWESSTNKPKPVVLEPTVPKVSTVASAATHPGGGPSHNLYEMSESSPASGTAKPAAPTTGGFWFDVARDMGLPTSYEAPTVQWQFSETEATTKLTPKTYSRSLDKDETRGVWVLLGLLAGSWVVGGIAKPTTKLPDHHEE